VASGLSLRQIRQSPHSAQADSANLRRQAEKVFDRCGPRQPMKAYAAAPVCRQLDSKPPKLPPSSRQMPASSRGVVTGSDVVNHAGCIRHAGSVPAIHQMSNGDRRTDLLDRHVRKPPSTTAYPYAGNVATPGVKSGNRQDTETPMYSGRRVHGRVHSRETGAPAALPRQPPTTPDFRHLIRHSALPVNRTPWK